MNAVLGFLKRDSHWPSTLYESGYRLTITERHANKVVRELILAVVKREFTFNELIQWFKERLIKA